MARPPGVPKATTVVAWVLPHLVTYVGLRGHDATPIRQLPGIRGRNLEDPDARVADAAAEEAWRVAVDITADKALGLHMAQAIPAGALDLLEFAIRSSATLGAGLEQLIRYGRVVSDRASARLVREDAALAVNWDGRVQRPRADFALAFLMRLLREATGRSLAAVEVRFAYPPPPSDEEYRAFFQTSLVWNAPANQLLFDRLDVASPFVTADPALAGVVERRLRKMLAQLPARDESAATRVRRQVIDQMSRGEPTARAVGRDLGVSERTLHRWLRGERTSFRSIVDEVRLEVATTLLRDRTAGITEIAFILGYSEPAAFYRAFRRWTGQTPLSFRRAG